MSEEALQIAEKRREAKGKGEKERYTHLNAEFQRIASRDKKAFLRTSLVIQELRLSAPKAGAPGSFPGQGTGSHMTQLGVYMPQLTITHAATKAWCSQINKNKY